MGRTSVEEYAEAVRSRYLASSRAGKQRILDEFCETTGYHRKAAIRLLRRPLAAPAVAIRGRGRPRQYSQLAVEALRTCWEVSGGICSKRLVSVLGLYVDNLERHKGLALSDEVRAQVLTMGHSTIDRLLRPYRLALKPRPTGHPPTVAHIRKQVPLRTHREWSGAEVGSVQADLVEHCGDNASGPFLYTLTVVDVATGWTECRPVLNKTMDRVAAAFHRIRGEFPMPLRAVHTDNGSEFINEQLIAYCRKHELSFTRGRPYRKNDQSFVEQRNNTAVRESVGYTRYSSKAAYEKLEELYGYQHLFMNFFQPVQKLVSKERHGAKVTKRYDRGATPYQRLLASGTLDAVTTKKLAQLVSVLDVAKLHHWIAQARHELWELRARPLRPGVFHEAVPQTASVTHL